MPGLGPRQRRGCFKERDNRIKSVNIPSTRNNHLNYWFINLLVLLLRRPKESRPDQIDFNGLATYKTGRPRKLFGGEK